MKENDVNEILAQVAWENHCSPEHVRTEIEILIDECWENPDPEIHAKWVAMSDHGERPTIAEVITAISAEVLRSRNQNLNRRFQFPTI